MVFMPIRETGAGIWNEVVVAVAKKNKIDELKKKLESVTEQGEKDNLQKQIDNLNVVPS
jgi:hypothetical protein